jgi:hypothetical protein
MMQKQAEAWMRQQEVERGWDDGRKTAGRTRMRQQQQQEEERTRALWRWERVAVL